MSTTRFIDVSAEKVIIEHLSLGREDSMEKILEAFPDIKPDWFTGLSLAWIAAKELHQQGRPVSSLTLAETLGEKGLVSIGGARVICPEHHSWPLVSDCLQRLQELAPKRAAIPIFKQASDGFLTVAETIAALEPLAVPTSGNKLKERRFSLSNAPEEAIPRLYLAGQGVCTAGNLTVITGQAKAGKSALLGGTIAALIDGKEHLGLTAVANTDGNGWVHFDTEQSRSDHHKLILRAMTRAEVTTLPDWLRSYSVADIPTSDRRTLLASEMAATRADCGRVGGVIVDGVADLCHDPNDPAEAFGLVEELHRLAIKYDCPIVLILHLNPGSLTNKTRGHLGSQLERKAESVIQLEKSDDGTVTSWLQYSRNGYLPKDQGVRFSWDDDEGMFMQVAGTRHEARAKAKTDKERAELERLAHLVIERNGPRKWGQFIDDLSTLCTSKKTAERKFSKMKALSILSQTLTGEWELAA